MLAKQVRLSHAEIIKGQLHLWLFQCAASINVNKRLLDRRTVQVVTTEMIKYYNKNINIKLVFAAGTTIRAVLLQEINRFLPIRIENRPAVV